MTMSGIENNWAEIALACETRRKIWRLFVHTMAARRDSTAAKIDAYHRSRGWLGIGYHWVVRKTGFVEPGRPMGKMGAGVGNGGNPGAIHVVFTGHGDYEPWTREQHVNGIVLLTLLVERFEIRLARVKGHREHPKANRTCPGKLINMDDVRSGVRSALSLQILDLGEKNGTGQLDN